uniref:NADH dehydrogenase subunit 3 n=1 Tax=Ornithodoros furcosus TaxID=2928876 RepID=UPI00223757BC|nr:NADH dehydrogenase subunit 3 [Ornithodoros furcosus]UYB78320.1 NADH dehydrogenase subunit 3 [Ornithodoros furcosus]UYB78333.1 NADH dehydrogenase subunit 3 [Ornithodoros furcosus]
MKFFITSFFISSLIMMFASLIKKKIFLKKEKNSPFECGFDPFSLSRSPFSIRFFMISIIFIIFDVEIIILLPFPLFNNFMEMTSIYLMTTIIIMILIGLIYEWKMGMIKWLV